MTSRQGSIGVHGKMLCENGRRKSPRGAVIIASNAKFASAGEEEGDIQPHASGAKMNRIQQDWTWGGELKTIS